MSEGNGLKRAAAPEWALPAAVGGVQLARLLQTYLLPDSRLANHIYDDAFYYFVLARNFVLTGRWTFDGVEPASGFHLLWGYMLAGIYWLRPEMSLHGILLVGGLIQTACLAGAAWLAARTAVRLYGPMAELGVALLFFSTLTLKTGLCMMEVGLVVLASAATIELLCRTDAKVTAGRLSAYVLLGVAGMMARSDMGLLPACLLAMQLVLWRRGLSSKAMVKAALAVFAGAVLGWIIVSLHTHWISGEWVQSSAREKLFWAQLHGFSTAPMRHLLLEHLDPAYYWTNWRVGERAGAVFARLAAILLAVGIAAQAWKRREERPILLGGLVCVVGGYLCFYRYNTGEVQDWYIANFQIPLAVLAGAGVAWWFGRAPRSTGTVVGVVCVAAIACSFKPLGNEDAGLYTAGMHLRAHPELRPAGAWNAGIINYFAGGGVVNLDGLVNDRIYAYAKSDTLLQYVQERHLRTLMDYPVMLDPAVIRAYHEWTFPRRGGYSDGRLQGCVVEENPSGGPVTGDPDTLPVMVYHVKPECMR